MQDSNPCGTALSVRLWSSVFSPQPPRLRTRNRAGWGAATAAAQGSGPVPAAPPARPVLPPEPAEARLAPAAPVRWAAGPAAPGRPAPVLLAPALERRAPVPMALAQWAALEEPAGRRRAPVSLFFNDRNAGREFSPGFFDQRRTTFRRIGILRHPGGVLIAAMQRWLPSPKRSRSHIATIVTCVIAIIGFSHSVVGRAKSAAT